MDTTAHAVGVVHVAQGLDHEAVDRAGSHVRTECIAVGARVHVQVPRSERCRLEGLELHAVLPKDSIGGRDRAGQEFWSHHRSVGARGHVDSQRESSRLVLARLHGRRRLRRQAMRTERQQPSDQPTTTHAFIVAAGMAAARRSCPSTDIREHDIVYSLRMRNLTRSLGVIGLALLGTSCVTYSGVTKSQDGKLYISGGTDYFFYTEPWVRLCDVDGLRLNCVELSESPSAPRGAAVSHTAAPAPPARPSAPPATSTAPPADAPRTSPQ